MKNNSYASALCHEGQRCIPSLIDIVGLPRSCRGAELDMLGRSRQAFKPFVKINAPCRQAGKQVALQALSLSPPPPLSPWLTKHHPPSSDCRPFPRTFTIDRVMLNPHSARAISFNASISHCHPLALLLLLKLCVTHKSSREKE